jgi:hypothetical protein
MLYKAMDSEAQAELDAYDEQAELDALDQYKIRNINVIEPRSDFGELEFLPRRDFVYGKHYLRGAVGVTIADGGIGKSAFVLCECIAMATGKNLLGVAVPKPLSVLYASLEDTPDEMKRRVWAICREYGIDPKTELGNFRYQCGSDHPIVVASMERGCLVIAENFAEQFTFYGYDVVVFDPFVKTHRVNENDNSAIDAVVSEFAKLAAVAEVAVELVHHVRKPAAGAQIESGVADSRGASALVNGARSVRVLNPMTEQEAQQAGVENRRMYFRANDGKANYGSLEGATWYQHAPDDLPNGDNVAAVKPWKFPSAFDGVTTSHMTQVRSLAADGEYRADPQSPLWIGEAVAEVLGLDVTDHKRRIKSLLKAWIESGVLKVEQRKDANRKVRMHVVPGDWTD